MSVEPQALSKLSQVIDLTKRPIGTSIAPMHDEFIDEANRIPMETEASAFKKIYDDNIVQIRKRVLEDLGLKDNRETRRLIKSRFRIKLDTNGLRNTDIDSLWRGFTSSIREQINSGEIEDKIYEHQIISAIEVSLRIILDERNGALLSPTQSGKTGAQSAIGLLCPALSYYITGHSCSILFVVPPHLSIAAQGFDEFESAVSVYGNIQIYSFTESRKRNLSHFADKHVKPALRRSNNVIKDIARIAKEHKESGEGLSILLDESHWGSNVGGVTDSILNDLDSILGRRNYNLIVISATPYEIMGHITDGRYWMVKQSLKSKIPYQGLTNNNGKAFVAGVEIEGNVNSLPYYSMQEYFHLRYLDNNKAYYIDNNKYHTLETGVKDQDKYRDLVNHELAAVVNNLLVDDNPQKGTGMAMRFARNKKDALDLSLNLRHSGLHDDVVIVLVDCKTSKNVSLEHQFDPAYNIYTATTCKKIKDLVALIENKHGAGTKILMMVTGSGRMGNCFPKSFTYFYEAIHESGQNDTLAQGLPGRASGFGKISVLFLSSENKEIMDAYCASNGIEGCGKVSARADRIRRADGTMVRQSKELPKRVLINLDHLYKVASAGLKKSIRRVRKDIKRVTGSRNSLEGRYNRDSNVLNLLSPHMDEIDAYSSSILPGFRVHVLREGEVTPWTNGNIRGYRPGTDMGMVFCGNRSQEAARNNGIRLRGKGEKYVTIETTNVPYSDTHTIVRADGGQSVSYWKPIEIMFPLHQEKTKHIHECGGTISDLVTSTGNEKSTFYNR